MKFLSVSLMTFILMMTQAHGFKMESFKKAQKEGKSIIVYFKDSSFEDCRRQGPILKNLFKKYKDKKIVKFEIPFTSTEQDVTDLKNEYSILKQCTLISFKGNSEQGRSSGQTSESSLESLFSSF